MIDVKEIKMYRNLPYGNTWQIFCFCIVFFIVLTGCQVNTTVECIAIVNGDKIFLSDFEKRLKGELDVIGDTSSLKEDEVDWLKEEILGKLIDEKIMLLRAKALSLSVSDEELQQKVEEIRKDYPEGGFDKMFRESGVNFVAWKEELRKGVVLEKLVHTDVSSKIAVKEDEAFAYYKDHPEEYVSGERVHVAQIVVQNRKEAEDILKRLKNGEDFGKVAQEVSTGPESVKGGDLGVFGRGVMPESFDEVVFSLPSGKTGNITKTPYGYHIFKVLKRDKAKKIAFPEAKKKILSELKKGKEECEYVKWLDRLRSEAVIKVNRDLLKKVKIS